jgi:FKBP-type peptidyl-prolyl cis-trans isomerase FkpA
MKRISLMWPVLALLAAGLYATGCKGTPEGAGGQAPDATTPPPAVNATATPAPAAPQATPTTATPGGKVHKLPSGLQYEDLVVGDGKMADPGLTAVVHYTGWLTDGTKFDSSLDRNQPFKFALGQHQVIDGWDQGVRGMRVGGKRKLTIPPDLGYGARGAGGVIPPNATLVFEVQLLDVQ